MPDRRPPVDVKELGERLKELRGERTQDDVVRAVEANQGFRMTASALSLLERGGADSPGARILDALAREYGETVEYLLYGVRPAKKKGA
ncbi:MAG TPA: helix-turn-helix transcriptional regulator [Candidatus Polarisedimenticolia bacterium]|nr:helix-turn-helix transcriptional regulator [Candidatus Polarisedimenticolia bacterium]